MFVRFHVYRIDTFHVKKLFDSPKQSFCAAQISEYSIFTRPTPFIIHLRFRHDALSQSITHNFPYRPIQRPRIFPPDFHGPLYDFRIQPGLYQQQVTTAHTYTWYTWISALGYTRKPRDFAYLRNARFENRSGPRLSALRRGFGSRNERFLLGCFDATRHAFTSTPCTRLFWCRRCDLRLCVCVCCFRPCENVGWLFVLMSIGVFGDVSIVRV